jgi:hypothetical protein
MKQASGHGKAGKKMLIRVHESWSLELGSNDPL